MKSIQKRREITMQSKVAMAGGIGILTLLIAFGMTLGPPVSHKEPANQVPVSMIVQGSDLETVSAAVHQVGGEITHELSIINAVGANLTPLQMDQLKAMGKVGIIENRGVSTDGYTCDLIGESHLIPDGKKMKWFITNTGSEKVTIDVISVTWPYENGRLKKIKLDGDEISNQVCSPPLTTIDAGWNDDIRRREIAVGETVDLLFEFEKDVITSQVYYEILVDFAEGCSLEFIPGEPCSATADQDLIIDGRKIFLVLNNSGYDNLVIDSISVEWPDENRRLKKIKLDGDEIFNQVCSPPSTTISAGWHDDVQRREIEVNQTEYLEIEFEADAGVDPLEYYILVEFVGGCLVEFPPGGDESGGDDSIDMPVDPPVDPPPVEGPEPGFYTVMDHFNAVSWDGNDGTVDFSGSWIEEGDVDGAGPATGSVFVSEYGHLYMQNSNRSLARGADLTGATWAQLCFYRWRHYNAWTEFDYVTIEISPDGGASWTELDRFGGPGYDHTWKWMNYNISDYATSEMMIRFQTSPDFGADDKLNLANIEIQFVVGDSGADSDAIVSSSVLVEADLVHDQGITGRFNTVAVLDTGYWPHAALDYNSAGYRRVKVQYNAIRGQVDTINGAVRTEENGHGSHVTSVIMNRERNLNNRYIGVAPGTDLASIKAFDRTGAGTYLDVIRGIDWVVQNKEQYDIRVLNCSFSAPAVSCYWDDPLAQAVMAAWNAGIVVVASAGNRGPDPMTIGVPGNVPYIITVGAVSDGFTVTDGGDDFLASFSSTGPTAEGFVKPEVVAPGGHVWALMPDDAQLVLDYPQFQNEAYYFSMSGTSQATAVVSGIAALMLEADQDLTPDQVKSRIIDSARPAVDANGIPVCSIFEQGAGMVNAYGAVHSTADNLANNGLDIVKELDGTEHYGGPANQREDGSFYIMDHSGLDDGTDWDGVYSWSDGQSLAYLWSDGHSLAYLWSDALGQAYLWSDAQGLAYLWSDALKYAYLWSDAQGLAYLWSDNLSETMSINVWVPQE